MNKERELLKEALKVLEWNGIMGSHDTYNSIKELLAQPEQEPVAYLHEGIDETGETVRRIYCHFYEHANLIPLYTAPPKREPFGPEERQRLSKAYSTRAEQVAFEEGIIFAEISYGIGGGE